MTDASSDDIGNAQATLTNWLATAAQADILLLAKKITIEPGLLTVEIDQSQVADILDTDADPLNENGQDVCSGC